MLRPYKPHFVANNKCKLSVLHAVALVSESNDCNQYVCKLKQYLTPFVIASGGDSADEVGRLSLSSSPLDLGRDPEDLGREAPVVPGLTWDR